MAHPAGGATQLTLNNILKEFYLGPVQEQLNNSVMVLDLMTKTTVDWNGRSAIIPIHVSRNTGVAFAAEGAHLPAAGEQGYQRLDALGVFVHVREQGFQVLGSHTRREPIEMRADATEAPVQ